MSKALPLAALACLAAFAAGCRSDQGPVSGELSVRLTTPRVGDRGIQFVVIGPAQAVSAPTGSGYRVFSDAASGADTTHVVVVAPAGTGLVAGDVARIAVSDTRQVRSYTAAVVALAAPNYSLADTTGVSLSVVRP